ncbi:hypothetical protein C7M84_002467 [Penaeus vannamei]|uniref:Uncharacterized protein n=1 Tax=Penaeus vannamei TaxID=6689 RepID=A0A423TQS3_PENVA|nr:hypothetical protein C7M84_002467 [Penaeus vannamei]
MRCVQCPNWLAFVTSFSSAPFPLERAVQETDFIKAASSPSREFGYNFSTYSFILSCPLFPSFIPLAASTQPCNPTCPPSNQYLIITPPVSLSFPLPASPFGQSVTFLRYVIEAPLFFLLFLSISAVPPLIPSSPLSPFLTFSALFPPLIASSPLHLSSPPSLPFLPSLLSSLLSPFLTFSALFLSHPLSPSLPFLPSLLSCLLSSPLLPSLRFLPSLLSCLSLLSAFTLVTSLASPGSLIFVSSGALPSPLSLPPPLSRPLVSVLLLSSLVPLVFRLYPLSSPPLLASLFHLLPLSPLALPFLSRLSLLFASPPYSSPSRLLLSTSSLSPLFSLSPPFSISFLSLPLLLSLLSSLPPLFPLFSLSPPSLPPSSLPLFPLAPFCTSLLYPLSSPSRLLSLPPSSLPSLLPLASFLHLSARSPHAASALTNCFPLLPFLTPLPVPSPSHFSLCFLPPPSSILPGSPPPLLLSPFSHCLPVSPLPPSPFPFPLYPSPTPYLSLHSLPPPLPHPPVSLSLPIHPLPPLSPYSPSPTLPPIVLPLTCVSTPSLLPSPSTGSLPHPYLSLHSLPPPPHSPASLPHPYLSLHSLLPPLSPSPPSSLAPPSSSLDGLAGSSIIERKPFRTSAASGSLADRG